MADIKDVAAYLVERVGASMTAMQLEKLTYYSQAWHLTWEGASLVDSPFQGWKQGPVARDLYDLHRKRLWVTSIPGGQPARLSSRERAIIDAVLDFYGGMTPEQLSQRTHDEEPWLESRLGLSDDDYGDREISLSTMARTYTRQVVEDLGTPTRPRGGNSSIDADVTLAEVDSQIDRWSDTLAWLADR